MAASLAVNGTSPTPRVARLRLELVEHRRDLPWTLDRVLPQARAHLFRAQFYHSLTKADLRAMVAEYRGITEAILEGDQAKAERLMRRHLQKSGERTLPRMAAFTLN